MSGNARVVLPLVLPRAIAEPETRVAGRVTRLLVLDGPAPPRGRSTPRGPPSGMSLETKASRANARQPLDDSVELRVAAEAGIECGSRERGSVA